LSVLDSGLDSIKGIGPKRAALFTKLGVTTVGALLRYYPRSYQDFSSVTDISACVPGDMCCIEGTVMAPVRCVRARGGLLLCRLRVADSSGECGIVFFNNRYVPNMLREGSSYRFCGRMGGTLLRREMSSPEFESSGARPGLLPVYPSTSQLPSRVIRAAAAQALAACAEHDELGDPMPENLRARFKLCHLRYALENIHFPASAEELATARRRLVFEELLSLQLGMLMLKSRSRSGKGTVFSKPPALDKFYASLPFEPTGAQLRAVNEAAADMRSGCPMNRLVEGDVGSGKTLVAAALCCYAADCGCQSAMMAPTEILARQHLETMTKFLSPLGLKVGLLSGGMKAAEKKAVKEALARHEIDLVVGTHALVQKDVSFDRLGLVITDEQHRFGVGQRAALESKGENPHVLVMSATPIPRTLGLIIYGDLDISVLDELPRGRREVKTYLVGSAMRERVYAFIRRHIDAGRQAFIVCPLVESGEEELVSAEEHAKSLMEGPFSKYRVGLLHGRLKASDKDRIMDDFACGRLDLLVSTTVVEVGVDVPNAAVMVIENAERFGLSQLHQLRGRVGRGKYDSYCILISDSDSPATLERLKTLTQTSDGFKIAEKDLALRGPGDFFGSRQHGLPELHIADLMSDMSVLHQAQQAAGEIYRADPLLRAKENSGLRDGVKRLFSSQDIAFN
jgi:ATP-dependent DNA helicase RecG